MNAPSDPRSTSLSASETIHGEDANGNIAGIEHNSGNFPSLMTVKECCRDARISAATFYRLAKKDPKFPALIKIGGSTRIRGDGWSAYLDALGERDGAGA